MDFVVYGEQGLFAFELKSRAHVERKDLAGLRAFKEDYPIAICYLINTGRYPEKHGDIVVLPIQRALMELPKILQGDGASAKEP